jgi:hypothetical protein
MEPRGSMSLTAAILVPTSMKSGFSVVTGLPLATLWRGEETFGSRRRDLNVEDLGTLLRKGRVAFVVADVGKSLEWVDPADCFRFWKTEVRPHISTKPRIVLDQFPGAYCYVASDWGCSDDNLQIVVLERHH